LPRTSLAYETNSLNHTNPMRQSRKILLIAGTFFVFSLALLMLFRGGHYLVKYDPLQAADALLILTGSKGDRALHAADIYHQGKAPLILIVNDHEAGKEYLAGRGIYLPNAAEITRDLLLQMQLPAGSIQLIPAAAQSTMDEAEALSNWLIQNEQIQSLIIVSSVSHTRRAVKIFENRFRKHNLEIAIISAPSPYTGFQAKGWYTHRESAKDVFNEYTKFVWYWLIERW